MQARKCLENSNNRKCKQQQSAKMINATRQPAASQLRPSQTMPQIHYTKQDIREQYMDQKFATPSAHRAAAAAAAPAAVAAAASKRPRQVSKSQNSRRRPESASDSDSSEGSESYPARARNKSRNWTGPGRRRRSKSASIFSSCFHIGSILPAASQRAPKLLARIGLAPSTSANVAAAPPRDKQASLATRTIPTSQTLGNLQSLAAIDDDDEPDGQWPATCRPRALVQEPASLLNGGPAGRKHVSFGLKRPLNGSSVAGDNKDQPRQAEPAARGPGEATGAHNATPTTMAKSIGSGLPPGE